MDISSPATRELTKCQFSMRHPKLGHLIILHDVLSIRRLPGIVTHTQYVIVLGGMDDSNDSFLDDIEILDWHENKQ